MIRYALVLPLCAAGLILLGGCSSVRDSLGLDTKAPDEFNVVSRAPLAMPATLGSLPEPEPGAPRPQEVQPSAQAQYALFGRLVGGGSFSNGQEYLIASAETNALEPSGAVVSEYSLESDLPTAISPAIRTTVDEEHEHILNDSTWLEDINPVTEYGDPTEVLIDVQRERERIQAQAARGAPINEGQFEAYIVVEEEKALLEDLF
ncbi:MAG: DUF3035 domain-containing protein [Rhodospirillales bacterium]|nr:DUF3035 domain-containing protein [Rhodospirillales bacterium]